MKSQKVSPKRELSNAAIGFTIASAIATGVIAFLCTCAGGAAVFLVGAGSNTWAAVSLIVMLVSPLVGLAASLIYAGFGYLAFGRKNQTTRESSTLQTRDEMPDEVS